MKKYLKKIIIFVFLNSIVTGDLMAYTEKLQEAVDRVENAVEYILSDVLFKYYLEETDRTAFPTSDMRSYIYRNFNAGALHIFDTDTPFFKDHFQIMGSVSLEAKWYERLHVIYFTCHRFYSVQLSSGYYEYWILKMVKDYEPHNLDRSIFYVTKSESIDSPREIIKKSYEFFHELEVEGGKVVFPLENLRCRLMMYPWIYYNSYENYPELRDTMIEIKYLTEDGRELSNKESAEYFRNRKKRIMVPYERKMTEKEIKHYRKRAENFYKKNS